MEGSTSDGPVLFSDSSTLSIINANNDCLIYLIVIIKSSIATSTVMRRKVKLIELTNSFLLWNYKFSYSFIIFTF
jgi:hypothetical protein